MFMSSVFCIWIMFQSFYSASKGSTIWALASLAVSFIVHISYLAYCDATKRR